MSKPKNIVTVLSNAKGGRQFGTYGSEIRFDPGATDVDGDLLEATRNPEHGHATALGALFANGTLTIIPTSADAPSDKEINDADEQTLVRWACKFGDPVLRAKFSRRFFDFITRQPESRCYFSLCVPDFDAASPLDRVNGWKAWFHPQPKPNQMLVCMQEQHRQQREHAANLEAAAAAVRAAMKGGA